MAVEQESGYDLALAIAGVIGQPFPRALLKAVLGTEEPVLELLDRGVLAECSTPGWIDVVEWEVAENAAARMRGTERRSLCRKLGQKSEALRLPEDMSASLYAMGQQLNDARRLWIRAAERACDRSEYADALDYMVNALEVWPWNESPGDRIRILREQARCAANAGRDEIARLAWQELGAYAEDNGQHELHVESLCHLARMLHEAR